MTKVTEAGKKYDAAYKEVFDFYKANVPTLNASSDFLMFDEKTGNPVNPVPHLFRCHSAEESDSGTVTVTDRFGIEYSTTISW